MDIKNRFKILIVDDEPEARFLLKSIVEEIDHVEVVGLASHAEEALYQLIEHYPDLVLLDINMPGKSGIEFMQLINKRNLDVPVVFISAYKKYAIQAIRSEVYNFLLKPVCRQDLESLILKYKKYKKRNLPGKLMQVLNNIREEKNIRINSRNSYIIINPLEIIYCISEDGYTTLHLSTGKKEVSNTALSHLEENLKVYNFFRLGRSTLVNLDHLYKVDKYDNTCVLKHNSQQWIVKAPRNSIKEMLQINFDYA